jgi:hypothetical protein
MFAAFNRMAFFELNHNHVVVAYNYADVRRRRLGISLPVMWRRARRCVSDFHRPQDTWTITPCAPMMACGDCVRAADDFGCGPDRIHPARAVQRLAPGSVTNERPNMHLILPLASIYVIGGSSLGIILLIVIIVVLIR